MMQKTEKNPCFAASPDGKQIAYDISGQGPAIVLLHGGGGRRQEWHEAGYVSRLQDHFTVITLDLRGHGESAKPTDPADYAIGNMVQDILAVVNACGVEQFAVWGMSYGGKVGRYLTIHTERVSKIILMGTPLGSGVTGKLRQDAIDFCAHWSPILQAQQDGRLDLASLSPGDQEALSCLNVPVMLGWVGAMLDWPSIAPADFRCPMLWLVGSKDPHAMASVKEYEGALAGSRVHLHIVNGLDHEQVFDDIDGVFPIMLAFTQA